MSRYNLYKFDSKTFVVFDHVEEREICVCSDYDDWTDAEQRAKRIVKALNALIIDYHERFDKFSIISKSASEKRTAIYF